MALFGKRKPAGPPKPPREIEILLAIEAVGQSSGDEFVSSVDIATHIGVDAMQLGLSSKLERFEAQGFIEHRSDLPNGDAPVGKPGDRITELGRQHLRSNGY